MQIAEDTVQIVAFTVENVEYALPISQVKEIIRYVDPQPTSASVDWMRGVINLRGSIVPVIDLGVRLGRTTNQLSDSHAKILVLEHEDTVAGAIVSTVDEVRVIEADQVQPAPAGAADACIESVVMVGDRLIMMLDGAAILTSTVGAA